MNLINFIAINAHTLYVLNLENDHDVNGDLVRWSIIKYDAYRVMKFNAVCYNLSHAIDIMPANS